MNNHAESPHHLLLYTEISSGDQIDSGSTSEANRRLSPAAWGICFRFVFGTLLLPHAYISSLLGVKSTTISIVTVSIAVVTKFHDPLRSEAPQRLRVYIRLRRSIGDQTTGTGLRSDLGSLPSLLLRASPPHFLEWGSIINSSGV